MNRPTSRAAFGSFRCRTPHLWFAPIALAVFVAGFRPAHAQPTPAQQTPPIADGARIRVTQSAQWTNEPGGTQRVGTLRTLTRDSLTVEWAGGAITTVPLATLVRLETSQGEQHYVGRGLLIGLLAGASTGAIVGAARYDETACGNSGCVLDFGRAFHAVAGAAVGGGIGLLAGGFVGATRWREGWQRVHLDALTSRLSVIPLPATRGVAVRWAIGR